jgi:superfamily II DNA or RNA helicase
MVQNAHFHPKVKAKVWDGKIKLFNIMARTLYVGLYDALCEFAKDRDYDIETEDELNETSFSLKEAAELSKSLSPNMDERDYQTQAIAHCIRKGRAVLISPTGSGKSFIIHVLTQYYKKKTLIVCPTIALVHQMAGDMSDYGYEDNIHKITGGVEKNTHELITISTWQSIYKQPKSWFKQFDVIFGDECHEFKAKSLVELMEKTVDCKIKFGFTGTLDDIQVNKLVLEGLFGRPKQVATTRELMDKGFLAQLNIKILLLKYEDSIRNICKELSYDDQEDFVLGHNTRNKFIKNLALSLKGNTIIFFDKVDKHGKILYDMIQNEAGDRKIFYIDGGINGEIRNDIRAEVEKENDAIVVASLGTSARGINIKNLHNMIAAAPGKAKIRILQSIGRGLRLSENGWSTTLFDIADDLSDKQKSNYMLKHLRERVEIYIKEKFPFKLYNIDIKES